MTLQPQAVFGMKRIMAADLEKLLFFKKLWKKNIKIVISIPTLL